MADFSRISFNTIDSFARRSKLPLVDLLTDYFSFAAGGVQRIIAFFTGRAVRYPSADFQELVRLEEELASFSAEMVRSSSRHRGHENLLMLLCFNEMRAALQSVRGYNRLVGSSVRVTPTQETIRQDITLRQGQTLAGVERDILGSPDARNSWVSLAVNKRIKEEDWTTDGGYRFSVDFSRDRRGVRSTQIFDVIDEPVKLLGIDISKDMSYDIRTVANDPNRYIDFKLLSYDQTFIQSIETLAALRVGDNPFYPDDGYSTATLSADVNFPIFFSQLAGSFSLDESIGSFRITNAERRGVSMRVSVDIDSVFGIAQAKNIAIDPELEGQRFELPKADATYEDRLLTVPDSFPIRLRVGERVYLPSLSEEGKRLQYRIDNSIPFDRLFTESNLFVAMEVPSVADQGEVLFGVLSGDSEAKRQSVVIAKGLPDLRFVLEDAVNNVVRLNAFSDSPVAISYQSTPTTLLKGDSISGYRLDLSGHTGRYSVTASTTEDSNHLSVDESRSGIFGNLIPISTLEQLDAMRYDLDGNGDPTGTVDQIASYNSAFDDVIEEDVTYSGYRLTTNLDFSGSQWENPTGGTYAGTRVTGGWVPIGTFACIFDGNGYTISNLYTVRGSGVGLFGAVGVAVIRDLGLLDVAVTSSGSGAGGLVGSISGTGIIENCYVSGAVSGSLVLGGLVGSISGTGSIENCYVSGAVSGSIIVGGLLGSISSSGTGTIKNCYTSGTVTGTGSSVGGLVGSGSAVIEESYVTGVVIGTSNAGGLVGFSTGSIENCYVSGAVTGTSNVGGLVGSGTGTITDCYVSGAVTGTSNVGGLVGSGTGTIIASYFDTTSTGIATGTGAQTTSALQSPVYPTGIYETWSEVIWDFGLSDEYPVYR